MPPTPAPCDWPMPDPACCPAWDTATDEEKQRAHDVAVYLLWAATGRAYGRCTTTIRPCARRCTDWSDWPPRPDGRLVSGSWAAGVSGMVSPGWSWAGAVCGCGARNDCSCTAVSAVELPGWLPEPVEVRIDGVPMDLAQFRVDDGRWLVWQDPDCTSGCGNGFPACQNLNLPTSCEGTWSITYTHGIPVPVAGQWAASELACELLKSCNPGSAGECRLPANVRAIHRQGVDIEFTNDGSATDTTGRLRFNVPAVDLWIAAVNPYGISQPATAWAPELRQPRVQTWP